MKKNVKKYVIAWAILAVIFNVIAFVTPSFFEGYGKFGASFWIGYISVMIALVGNLACAIYALNASTKEKLFLNIPLITISYRTLVLSFVVGIACILLPIIPWWVCAIVCAFLLGFSAISIIKANVAAEAVSSVDEKIKTQTNYMRMLTADAESLTNYAKTDEDKKVCKQIYEAIRYSDPVSNEVLKEIESEISDKLTEFKTQLKNNECNQELANVILNLIKERNNKCKVLK
jgi:hypothetical protein